MTKPALTEKVWLRTLASIKISAPDDTTRTLAQVLSDIIEAPGDMPEILDTYGRGLLAQP
jgi:hypothetical protein